MVAVILHMNLCATCGTSDGVSRSYCQSCRSAYVKAYYGEHYDKIKAKRNERVQRNREIVRQHLIHNPCMDCGETDFVVLQFDHLRDKIESVSKMVQQGRPVERLTEEIAKCEVVCANCHMRRTAKQFGWKVLDF